MCWMCWNYGWGGWDGGGWGGLVGIIGLLLNLLFFVGLLALVGGGIAWLVRQMGRPSAARGGPDPQEIARRRLAAGEISVAEYEEIRNRLRS